MENIPKVLTQTKEVIQIYYTSGRKSILVSMEWQDTQQISEIIIKSQKSEGSHVHISSYLFGKDLGDYQSNLLKKGKGKQNQ